MYCPSSGLRNYVVCGPCLSQLPGSLGLSSGHPVKQPRFPGENSFLPHLILQFCLFGFDEMGFGLNTPVLPQTSQNGLFLHCYLEGY